MILLIISPVNAQLAAGEGKCPFVGNVISSSVPATFNNYWNQVTPENAGKWASVESTRDVMNWGQLDQAYAHAKTHNYPFKQHTFIWDQQKPSWITGLTEAEQKEEVEEWIRLYGERYPDTDFIDVVNEPLHAVPAYRDAIGGTGETGYDWVIWSFEKARLHNPNAKLLLNDFNILNSFSATKSYLYIIGLLKDRGLIDGIGLQGHFLETSSNSIIKSNLDKLAATGLPIYISEYDINISDDTQQLNKMKEQFPLLYQHSGVQGITLWGYEQGKIWRTDAYLVRSNGTERPALQWLRTYLEGRCSGIVSVEDIFSDKKDQMISIYPNPVTDGQAKIEFKYPVSFIHLSDLSGKTVFNSEVANGVSSFNLELALMPGIYLLQALGDKKLYVEKIMIK